MMLDASRRTAILSCRVTRTKFMRFTNIVHRACETVLVVLSKIYTHNQYFILMLIPFPHHISSAVTCACRL